MQDCTIAIYFQLTALCSYMFKETVNNLFYRNKWGCQEKSRSALKNNQIECTLYTNPRCVNRLDLTLGILLTVLGVVEHICDNPVTKQSGEDITLNSVIHFGRFLLGYC